MPSTLATFDEVISFEFRTGEDWLTPILFILGGLVLGILCERVVLSS